MRDVHKWKDKVEFSLDTRQVFFLFFGLSIAGCVVFVLGLMMGRSTSWQPNIEAMSDTYRLGFPSAIHASVANPDFGDDHTRNQDAIEDRPGVLSRKPMVSNVGSVAQASGEVDSSENQPPTASRQNPTRQASTTSDEGRNPLQSSTSVNWKPAADPRGFRRNDTLVASISSKSAIRPTKPSLAKVPSKSTSRIKKSAKAKRSRAFTLMLKSFAEIEEAQRLANQLKSNGHEVRLESYEARGRTWHRVLLGNFDKWDDGLKAKSKFEKSEHLIAWLIVKPES